MSRKWVSFIAVVTFDVEYGQKLELVFPREVQLEDNEKTAICFSSFPDSQSRKCNDVVYSFRYPHGSNPTKHRFGYVFFRQSKDSSRDRGYLQKSVIIVSSYGFISLFENIVSLVGPHFFEQGVPLLEVVMNSITKWPVPRVNEKFDLPLLGYVFNVHIPAHIPKSTELTQNTISIKRTQSPMEFGALLFFQCTGQFHEIPLFQTFKFHLQVLWSLWELVLAGRPMLVLSTSPKICTHAVFGLISLISPLRIGIEYRPYFTVHDPEFREFTQPELKPNILVGVTNPYFLKARDWENLFILGDSEEDLISENDEGIGCASISPSSPSSPSSSSSSPLPSLSSPVSGSPSSPVEIPSIKTPKEFRKQFSTKFKIYVKKQKNVLKHLHVIPAKSRDPKLESANDTILRKHFMYLNEKFLYPLDKYLTSLLPTATQMSPFSGEPSQRSFRKLDFLEYLLQSDAALRASMMATFGQHYVELYRRFMNGPNFTTWYTHRCKQGYADVHRTYLRVCTHADVRKMCEGRSEMETIDLYMKIRDLADNERESSGTQSPIVKKLKSQMSAVVNSLSPDLQNSIKMMEERNKQEKKEQRAKKHRRRSSSSRQAIAVSSSTTTTTSTANSFLPVADIRNASHTAPSTPLVSPSPSPPPTSLENEVTQTRRTDQKEGIEEEEERGAVAISASSSFGHSRSMSEPVPVPHPHHHSSNREIEHENGSGDGGEVVEEDLAIEETESSSPSSAPQRVSMPVDPEVSVNVEAVVPPVVHIDRGGGGMLSPSGSFMQPLGTGDNPFEIHPFDEDSRENGWEYGGEEEKGR